MNIGDKDYIIVGSDPGGATKDGELFLKLLAGQKCWGNATQKTCFDKKAYTGLD
jgi:hypothetical protein